MSLVVDQPVAEGSEQTAPSPEAPPSGPTVTGPGRRTKWLLAGAAAVASAMGGGLAYSTLSSSPPSLPPAPAADAHALHHSLESKTRPISRQQLASKYGIRLTLVGVTASGGLVDLRFKITDAAKARKLFTNPSVMPAVVAEPTGVVLTPPHGGHHAHVTPATGASYFVLIGNAGGVVQRGVPVSVLFNSVRVEHIVAVS